MQVDEAGSLATQDGASTSLASRLRLGAAEAGHVIWGGARIAVASTVPVLVLTVVSAGVTAWSAPTGSWWWIGLPAVLTIGALLSAGVLVQTFWVGMVSTAIQRTHAASLLCELLFKRIASDPTEAIVSIAQFQQLMQLAAREVERTWQLQGGVRGWLMSIVFRRLMAQVEQMTLGMIRDEPDLPLDVEALRERLVARVDGFVQDRLTEYRRKVQRGAMVLLTLVVAAGVVATRYGLTPAV
jgi:hypothetical protein